MAQSQNGYSVLDRSECRFYDVGPLSIPLRADDAGYVMAHFSRMFNNRVERLGPTETFGHSARRIGGSDEWSNHASGTAVDLNSAQHPHGSRNTFRDEELVGLRLLLEDYDEVIRWGGDYRYTKDEMHFEIDKSYSDVKKLAQVLRQNNQVSLSKLQMGKRNINVYMVKRALNKKGLFRGEMSNYYGAGLKNSYADFQRSLGYSGDDADGIPGVQSLAALGLTVK